MVHCEIQNINHIPDKLLVRDDMLTEYPDYIEWIKKCRVENRTAFILYSGNTIIGYSAIKISKLSVKICNFYIVNAYRHHGYGSFLLDEIEAYAKKGNYERLYITILKNNIETRKFFLHHSYNSINITHIGEVVYEKHLSLQNQKIILLSLKPKYWNEIISGKKEVELRRKFTRMDTTHCIVYVGRPVSGIQGIISIKKTVKDSIKNIKNTYLKASGITETEYDTYAKDSESLTAIIFERVTVFKNVINLSEINMNRPPQNYLYLNSSQTEQILESADEDYERLY